MPLNEIENEYGKKRFCIVISRYCFIPIEQTIEYYLDSMLINANQHETIDQRTSQWIDDIKSVNRIFSLFRLIQLIFDED